MYYTHSPAAIGGIITRDNNGTKLFYHYDRLGNVMAVSDSNGNMYAGYTMEAFGGVLEVGTSTGYYSSQSDPQPYHLTTKEYDPDSGLYYFSARWYDPTTGRFVSRAFMPVTVEHQYGLCRNAPPGCIDADGRTAIIIYPPELRWLSICYECAKRVFETLMAGRLGLKDQPPNDPYNNLRHCIGAAMIAVQCGCICSEIAGWGHEAQTWFGGDWRRDVKMNTEGMKCAGCRTFVPAAEDIWCCCEKATGTSRPGTVSGGAH